MPGIDSFFDVKPPQFLRSGIQIDWTGFNPTEPFAIHFSSTCLDKMFHNPLTATTEVYFVAGDEYEYYDIPIHVILEWIQSSSVGRYFNYHIRNNYSYSQIG